jgi:hypothetical protein
VPIRPENRDRYPANWKAIRRGILVQCEYRCECHGQCGTAICCDSPEGRVRCHEEHGKPALTFRGRVVLTIAHLDHMPENCTRDNLKAMCQRCHNAYDKGHRAETRARTKARTGR